MKIELNAGFKKALRLLEKTSKNVFITGKAGTGKSTLLTYFREHTEKKVAVLAPTGVAALNVQGQTIHSFCRFRPSITPEGVKRVGEKRRKLYENLDTVVIDEISMVRADLLDCVEKFFRLNGPKKNQPFGGVQMVFIGDLYQLPPVTTGEDRKIFTEIYPSPYFFDARAFPQLDMEFIELTKVYRQTEAEFIEALNLVRNNTIEENQLAFLNKRCDPDFAPPPEEFFIYLTSTNRQADEINAAELAKTPEQLFRSEGFIEGKFNARHLPTEEELDLKTGAQIMLLNNDRRGRWVNGTVGKVVKINKGEGTLKVDLQNGETVKVEPYTWEIFEYRFDEKTRRLTTKTVGTFTQLPLRLAWAVTIHKSQGKSFDRVIVDLGAGAFAHGQTYVALSRCRTLAGLVLKKPLLKRHVLMDWRVVRFLTSYQYRLAEKELSLEEKTALIETVISKSGSLEIVYLKASDEKSKRVLTPREIGTMEYLGKKFFGVAGFDSKRGEERVFRVDRILELKVVD